MALLLVSVVVALALVGCSADVPTATPAPEATPTSASLPVPATTATPTPLPTLVPTPTAAPPSATDIVESATKNLRAASSYHVNVAVEEDWRVTTIKADIVVPDMGHFLTYRVTHMLEHTFESTFTEGDYFIRPPGFQVWFSPLRGRSRIWNPGILLRPYAFPFELSYLRAVNNLTLRGTKVVGDVNVYRITGTATTNLVGYMKSYVQSSNWDEELEVEIWISQADLLPMRIEARFEEMSGSFRATFSDFGAEYDIPVPEKVLRAESLALLWAGELSPEERGQLVGAFSIEGKECLEGEIGTDLYQKVLSGESGADRVFRLALWFCETPIFSTRGDDYIDSGISQYLYVLDVSSLSIVPRGNRKFVMECLRDTIGLEELFEIGWGDREPTPEEVEAAAVCQW